MKALLRGVHNLNCKKSERAYSILRQEQREHTPQDIER